jgi:hypothetical protein
MEDVQTLQSGGGLVQTVATAVRNSSDTSAYRRFQGWVGGGRGSTDERWRHGGGVASATGGGRDLRGQLAGGEVEAREVEDGSRVTRVFSYCVGPRPPAATC